MKKILVLDIGGTFIKYGLIADGKLELFQKKKTPKTLNDFKDTLKKSLQFFRKP